MSKSARRVFSRKFKLSAVNRMLRGENVSERCRFAARISTYGATTFAPGAPRRCEASVGRARLRAASITLKITSPTG